MGAIIAKFRKEKTTTEILEKLEGKIQEIEKYTLNTQEQKKRFVATFLTCSIGLYVIAFLVFYFVYFPPTWRERATYLAPLLLFPIVIIFLRKVFTWYFQRKLNKNSDRLKVLRAEKKKILEEVMDKETYKVAVALLARFGEKTNPPRTSFTGATPKPVQASPVMAQNANALTANRALMQNRPPPLQGMNTSPYLRLNASRTSVLQGTPQSSVANYAPRQLALAPYQPGQELRRRTPFPVVDYQNKGIMDRFVDVIMGDGPRDRFAMICKECYSHNGMALKEDFDYTPFRCAFCHILNPARKTRMVAPPLTASPPYDQSFSNREDNSDDSGSSGEDSEKAFMAFGETMKKLNNAEEEDGDEDEVNHEPKSDLEKDLPDVDKIRKEISFEQNTLGHAEHALTEEEYDQIEEQSAMDVDDDDVNVEENGLSEELADKLDLDPKEHLDYEIVHSKNVTNSSLPVTTNS